MKRFYKDERGSSLVMTIIAMAFISLLAVAVITLTVTNIRLKLAQKGSQKNFYTTDSIMDEVRAGVDDMVASAAVEAYMEAFSSYGASLSGGSDTLTEKYNKKFLETMIHDLSGGKSSYGDSALYYKDEVIQAYLLENPENLNRYILHSLHPGGDTKSYGSLVMQNDTLLIKDLQVTMTENNKSYKTTLTADIRVNIPAMKADTRSELLNYALLADNQVIANVGGTATVEGGIYAGTVKRYDTSSEIGILVGGHTTLNVKAEHVVTRGDLFVHGGSTFSLDKFNGLDAHLWAENVFTSNKDGSGNAITLKNGVWNVADDMEIGGVGDTVTVTGDYYGYNYNYGYDGLNAKSVSSESKYSSAIMINGQNSNLDMSGLKRLVLSGKTFISKKTNTGETDERVATAPSATAAPIMNADIAMGESLTVKGSQIAYYVPNDFVNPTSSAPAGNSAKIKKFYFPLDPTSTEYTFDVGGYLKYLFGLDPATATDAELDATIAATSSGFDLMDYLDPAVPVVSYYRNDKTVEANSVTYYYLNFKNETMLMQFYPTFVKLMPRYSAVKDTNAAYLGATGISLNDGAVVWHHEGNLLYKDASSADLKIEIGNESTAIDTSILAELAIEKTMEYMSRQLSLSMSCDTATKAVNDDKQYRLLDNKAANLSKSGEKDKTNLYDVIIDSSKMPANLVEDSSGSGVVIIQPGTTKYTWNSSKKSSMGGKSKGIIIAAGDVEVEESFSGLIISGKDIHIKASGISVKADCELLEKMFKEDQEKSTPVFFDIFSEKFKKEVNSSIGQDKDANKDAVQYEKWKKE